MGLFPSLGGDGHFWPDYQVVSSLSPGWSLSCLHGCSPVSTLLCLICFPCSLCSLMSPLLVCSHNLSPALSASSSGTWIIILIHLAGWDKCCLCSDGELSCSYFPTCPTWPISCWKTLLQMLAAWPSWSRHIFYSWKVHLNIIFALRVDCTCLKWW